MAVKIETKVLENVGKIATILLVIFGLFVAYQIIRVILGGSWSVEDIILSLVIFNIGAVFTTGLMLATLGSDVKHLSGNFNRLAADFKGLANDFKEHVKKHK